MRPEKLAGPFVALLLWTSALYAQPPDEAAFRSDWMPSGAYSEGAIGDLWTFTCPSSGTVSVWVDTEDDTGAGTSNIDPIIEVVDKRGHILALGNDNASCSNTPTCASSPSPCPRVLQAKCGKGNPHSIVLYSVPSATCTGGGGYKLWVATTNKAGKAMSAKAIKLGGGAKRTAPKWADEITTRTPSLDDEGVPSFAYPGIQTFLSSVPGYTVAEVELEWDPSPSPETDGYRVYYGLSSRNYTVQEDVGNSTTHTFRGLDPGTTYYFTVAAYDSGTLSAYSNEISATIPLPTQ